MSQRGVIDEPPSYILLRWVSQTLPAMLARPVLRFYFVFQVGGKVDAKLKTFTSPDRYDKLESVLCAVAVCGVDGSTV